METLTIPPTQSSPAIVADGERGVIEMRGDSYPENSYAFFEPLVAWFQAYLAETDLPLRLELHLLYLNTSSVKIMMDLLDALEDAHQTGREVAVKWFYDAENERIAELANEFKEDCSFPFDILAVEADARP